ncbi:MAG: CmcJ/NvfI family oxidoreductase, partial [Pseudomonadota bacterium]
VVDLAHPVREHLIGGNEVLRLVQVNVWRPITGPVQRAPLALADASTIEPQDLVATDQVFPDRVGEIYHVAHSPAQRWYWAPEMTRDEVLLIKGWDSLEDGRARFTPHTAFEIPGQDPAAPARESIEIRTYAVIG